MNLPKRHRPGSKWRLLVHEYLGRGQCGWGQIDPSAESAPWPTEFDELVVDDWLHIEQMSPRTWWMRLGPLHVNVSVGERGQAETVSLFQEEDDYIAENTSTGWAWWKR